MVVVVSSFKCYIKVKINIGIDNSQLHRYDGNWVAVLVTVVQARYQCEDKMFLPHLAPPTISPSPAQPSPA